MSTEETNRLGIVTLPSHVENFVEDLLEGGLSLSRTASKKIIGHCSFWTALTPPFDLKRAEQLNAGGMSPASNSIEFLFDYLSNFLSKNDQNFLVIEHILARPRDLLHLPVDFSNHFFVEDIYFLLTKEDKEIDKVRIAIRTGSTATWFIALAGHFSSTIPAELKRKFWSIDELSLLAEHTNQIILGVYDGEGFLVCDSEI